MASDLFPTTIWSLVRRADDDQSVVRGPALDDLLRRYAPAMTAHLVRRKRVPPDQADDLVQGFIADKVLEKRLVGMADPNRGRFRTLLLTALDRYAVSAYRAASAKKRGGGQVASLEALGAPAVDSDRPADPFDVDWARGVLDQALTRMRTHCTSTDRDDLWGVFCDRLLTPTLERTAPPPYEQLVKRYAIATPAQAANVLITGKRMFARTLKEVIAEYAGDDDDAVGGEMEDLMRVLGQAAPCSQTTAPTSQFACGPDDEGAVR